MSRNEFMTDEEYKKCFVDFWGIRSEIANLLTEYGFRSGARVLDVPAGHGFFSCEIAGVIDQGSIHAVGLLNDVRTFTQWISSLQPKEKYEKLIQYYAADAAHLPFSSQCFDFVVNFLGLEDINMTSGLQGVQKSLSEFVRVTVPEGVVQLTLCLEGDEPDQVLARKVMEYLGCNAVFYPKKVYTDELENRGVHLIDEVWFHTHRKMTAPQAEEELRFACDMVPKIFHKYHVRTRSFKEVWQKFGKEIEKHGMAYYSDLCVLIGRTQ